MAFRLCRQASIFRPTTSARLLHRSIYQLNSKLNTRAMASRSTTYSTPMLCVADFCLLPLGTSSPSVSEHIADIQRLLKKSGLKYSMHANGTSVEGPWDEVCSVIGQAHEMLHQKGVPRCHSDIRIGSRIDKTQSTEDKVDAVNKLLAQDKD